jgi:hypothetical protein
MWENLDGKGEMINTRKNKLDCVFEVGKTYKNLGGEEALVIATPDMLYNSGTNSNLLAIVNGIYRSYDSLGRFIEKEKHILDLIPPKPKLKPIIGGIYKDNFGSKRVLVKDNRPEYMNAILLYPATKQPTCVSISRASFPVSVYPGEHELLELVSDISFINLGGSEIG